MRFDLPNGGHVQALENVSLDIQSGELLSVLGPSGCGKTTLLNIVAGFLAPTEGEIVLNDHTVTGPSPERGMVFQQGALFEWMDVRANVSFGPDMQGISRAESREKIEHLLDVVGLHDFKEKAIYELSGGMQKRVGLARAIAAEPEIIFFDEPTTGLDPIMSGVINALIREIVVEMGATAMTITHDMSSVRAIADKVAMLHDGVIQWTGPVSDMDSAHDPYLDQFIHGRAEGPIEAVR